MTLRIRVVEVHTSRAPEIGRWLWALQDARSRTLEELEDVTPAMVDWLPTPGHALRGASQPPDDESSIGAVLYHLAGIEADWLYAEVLEQPEFPPEVAALFSHATRDEQGHLTQVTGIRQDAWANANRIPVEENKPEGERGLTLHPEALGQPKSLGLDYQRDALLPDRLDAEETTAP